jgi:hypothetical protein
MPENFDTLIPATTFIDGGLYARVRDADNDENNVLEAAAANTVFVHWHLEKVLAGFLPPTSQWRVEVKLEPIGGGVGPVIAPALVPYGTGTLPRNWSTVIPLGALTPDAYKMVVLLSWEFPAGTPTPMAGFYEIPMIRVI